MLGIKKLFGKKEENKEDMYQEAVKEVWAEMRTEYKEELKKHIKESEFQKLEDEFLNKRIANNSVIMAKLKELEESKNAPAPVKQSKFDKFMVFMRKLADSMKMEGQSDNYFAERTRRMLGSNNMIDVERQMKKMNVQNIPEFRVANDPGPSQTPIIIVQSANRSRKKGKVKAQKIYLPPTGSLPQHQQPLLSEKMQSFESKMKKFIRG